MLKTLITGLALGACLADAPAAVLLNEPFDYSNGSLVTVSGTRWQSFAGIPGEIQITNARVSLLLNDGEDAQAVLSPPPSTDVVYAGFSVRFTKLPSSGGGYFAMFKGAGSTTDFRARVWALTNSAGSGKFRLGLSSTASALNVTHPMDLSPNTDYRVVIRLWNATGAASLWINPASESGPSVTTSESPSSSTVVAFALRQGGGTAQLSLDDLMVGESFAEVVSTNPPPAVPPLPAPAISVLTYNANGNMVADWSTNSTRVQAIGRQVMYLDPDIITFQEIPMTNNGWAKMPDFVTAFRPGFYLATNSGTDGFIRSAILSRFPITRSQSWLDAADLKPFGYTNTENFFADKFTRDLFEAEIAMPNLIQPLHVFTTHLKSGSADAAKRAAEASAISNFFVTVFLPVHGDRPYLLTGDLNEDIADPSVNSLPPLQRLVNDATGLHLTTPRNPLTDGWRTHSIRNTNGLASRYDYILPGGLLYSNFAGAQVFRTDLLDPLPLNLLSNDSATASDHLPVMMWFGNPYATPFRLLSADLAAGMVALTWETMSNCVYGVEMSTNLSTWEMLTSNLVATGTNTLFTNSTTDGAQFYRVFRVP